MPEGRLYIGTRRYSSWSMRGWLPVRIAGLDVEEVVIPLAGGNTPGVKAVSPTGMVPLLEHRGNRVWESIAICEYCAELAPELWPRDFAARAHARAIAAEMHAGFRELRQTMPMNLGPKRRGPDRRDPPLDQVARIDAIWRETRARFGAGGPYLFGATFTAADAMYAPVVTRFLRYEPPVSREARDYCDAVRAHPLVAEWHDEAAREPAEWVLDSYETIS